MDEYCFVVTFKDGTVFKFNHQCDKIDYGNERVVVFKEDLGDQYAILAMIPYENINYILREEKTNE